MRGCARESWELLDEMEAIRRKAMRVGPEERIHPLEMLATVLNNLRMEKNYIPLCVMEFFDILGIDCSLDDIIRTIREDLTETETEGETDDEWSTEDELEEEQYARKASERLLDDVNQSSSGACDFDIPFVPPPPKTEVNVKLPPSKEIVFKAKNTGEPTPEVVLTSANHDKSEGIEAFLDMLEQDEGYYFQVLQADSPSQFYLDYLEDQKTALFTKQHSEEHPSYVRTNGGRLRPLFWADIQKYYGSPENEEYIKRLNFEDSKPIVGRMYATKLGKYWERVRVLSIFPVECSVQIVAIDLGSYKMKIGWEKLVELLPTFFGYHPACVASLASVAPVFNKDGLWSRKVCKEFAKLVLGRRFFVIIRKKTATTYPETDIGIGELEVGLIPLPSEVNGDVGDIKMPPFHLEPIRSINAELVALGLAQPAEQMSCNLARVKFPKRQDDYDNSNASSSCSSGSTVSAD